MATKIGTKELEIDPATGKPIDPANSAAPGGWTLGNGSTFVMPNFDNMPKGSIGYANLADQMIDAQKMIDAGPGRFNGNTSGRYAFGGGNYGSDNPLAAKGQGLLAFGNGGGGPGGYNPFAGRGNGPFGPPGGGGGPGGPPGGAPGGGLLGPGAPVTNPTAPPGAPGGPRGPTNPGTIRGNGPQGTIVPGTGTSPKIPGAGLLPPTLPTGVPFPDWAKNYGTPPAANNTPSNAALAASMLPEDNAKLLAALGGNNAAANQMGNYYGPGGQGYNPQTSADLQRGDSGGISTLMPAIKALYEQQGMIVNGKWAKKMDPNGQWIPV